MSTFGFDSRWLSKFAFLVRLDLVLVVVFGVLFYLQMLQKPDLLKALLPEQVYSFSFSAFFEPDDGEINIHTYIPVNNAHQLRLHEETSNQLAWEINKDSTGRKVHWSGDNQATNVQYTVYVATQTDQYNIDEQLMIPDRYDESLESYLQESPVIQVNHPEIVTLWNSIKPANTHNTVAVLKTIYDYTYRQLESAPFKGTTDALTALRLGIASCNGKSRLFVALARLNNLPARLVGGVILDENTKRTSHQWVEVFIEDHWVPFGPTNGYFASLPAHYLRLYQGDQALIRHTSNINFDFQFDIKADIVPPAYYQDLTNIAVSETNLSVLLSDLGLSAKTISIILLLPACALLITFLRNVIGCKTFGIFMPMLIAAACLFSGLSKGLLSFLVLLSLAWLVHLILDKMRLLKTARLAIVVTCITVFFLLGLWLFDGKLKSEFGMLSVFPVVIIAFIAERIHQITSEQNWKECILTGIGTLVTVCLCYLTMNSVLLQGVFSLIPETYLLVFAAQIYIGRWSGLRISELFRFKSLLQGNSNQVLGINGRNRDYVYLQNEKKWLLLATDKLATKQSLARHQVPVPKTIAIFKNYSDLSRAGDILSRQNSMVLKPNAGSQGKGILVIRQRLDSIFLNAGGKRWSTDQLTQHIKEIINGTFSQNGEADTAYLEPVIQQHAQLQDIADFGLSDIRIIVSKGQPLCAMLRIPTKESSGKANLHQGAIGVAIDISTGITSGAQYKSRSVQVHPDTNAPLLDIQIPYWPQIVAMASRCYDAIPLGYLGVDICLDRTSGPLVLEVNGRPGLEIQNVRQRGFHEEFLTLRTSRHETATKAPAIVEGVASYA